jgi:translation initiation factor 3 subunit K
MLKSLVPNAFFSSYQFNPELYNADVVINILIKALTSAHFPDFNLCISLLDERVNALHADRDEPDPLPTFLPILTSMYTLLRQCRFVDFWELYRSEPLDDLRDNYTIECVGLEDAVRDVVIRSVKMTFTRISLDRLGSYLDLSGQCSNRFNLSQSYVLLIQCMHFEGEELEAYIQKIGWFLETSTVRVPKSPDNQLEATIVEESIQFPRASAFCCSCPCPCNLKLRFSQN